MDVALQDAPGVTSSYNLITDLGGAVDPNTLASTQLIGSAGLYLRQVFNFSLSSIYNTQHTAAQNAATAMTFNRIGILGGPLKHADGTANVGGVLTIKLLQGQTGVDVFVGATIAQATVDLTTWVPGQFYWSDPFPNPITIWGRIQPAPGYTWTNYYFNIIVSASVPYSMYGFRPVTVRNGNQWGSGLSNPPYQYPNNDHTCIGGPVDLSMINYVDLGTASLSPPPSVVFSGQIKRMGSLGPVNITPQIHLKGHPRVLGVFDPSNLAVEPVLYASSMAGGPLWKPSKLCTG